jgi:hypothetical protein
MKSPLVVGELIWYFWMVLHNCKLIAPWVTSREVSEEYNPIPHLYLPPHAFLIKKKPHQIADRLELKKEKKNKEVKNQVKRKVKSSILYPNR